MQIEKNIAATLQSKMKEAGKTKLEFSKEPGIPRSTLQGYLKGDKCLRSDSIEELARSLSVSPAQLISGPDYAKTFGLFSMTSLLAELQTAASAGAGPCKGRCFAVGSSVPSLGGMEPAGRTADTL